jgi:hypothetical protein
MLLKLGASTLIIRGTFTHFKPMVQCRTHAVQGCGTKHIYQDGGPFLVYFLPILGGQKAAVSGSGEGWCAAGSHSKNDMNSCKRLI